MLFIPPNATPGTYTLIATLYEEATLQRLRVEQGGKRDYVTLTTLHSAP